MWGKQDSRIRDLGDTFSQLFIPIVLSHFINLAWSGQTSPWSSNPVPTHTSWESHTLGPPKTTGPFGPAKKVVKTIGGFRIKVCSSKCYWQNNKRFVVDDFEKKTFVYGVYMFYDIQKQFIVSGLLKKLFIFFQLTNINLAFLVIFERFISSYFLFVFFVWGRSQTMLRRFWLFLTTFHSQLTFSTLWTLTKS